MQIQNREIRDIWHAHIGGGSMPQAESLCFLHVKEYWFNPDQLWLLCSLLIKSYPMINHNAIFKWSCWQNNECMFYVLYRKKTGKDSTGWINTAVSLMWVLIVGVYITSKLIMNNIIYYGKDFSFMLPPSFFLPDGEWWYFSPGIKRLGLVLP